MKLLLSYFTQKKLGIAFVDDRNKKVYYTFIDMFGDSFIKTSRWTSRTLQDDNHK